ncbi:uncharacterized protein LOC133184792 isoform X2 [Saccostrea echinata]|uniref:uncharacterized protein LOC133184792 isoform X2 n=1 Tax=Saccostrea echinata TaxID=191078 RepID=UPI002A835DBD|nr:uncharacterized protein LOC133184792 isoform X2 [Saccostrea echinata]
MVPRPLLLYLQILVLASGLAQALGVPDNYQRFMDSYGTCQHTSFFEVEDNEYYIHAKGSGQAYQALRCSLRFRTYPDQQLCVKFDSFRIEDCAVHFKVFQENQPIDFTRQPNDNCLYRHYGCRDSPQTVCSTDRFLTLQLYKERIDAVDYDFSLTVMPKTMQNEIIMSLGVMVGVIVGVVVFIAILAIFVLFCCCKKDRHHGRVFKKKNSKPRASAQGRLLEPGPEPSAPPLDPDMEMHQHIATNYGHYPNEPPPPYEPKPEPV